MQVVNKLLILERWVVMEKSAKYFGLFLVAVIVLLTVLSMQGCQTVEGFGRDLSSTSIAIREHYNDRE